MMKTNFLLLVILGIYLPLLPSPSKATQFPVDLPSATTTSKSSVGDGAKESRPDRPLIITFCKKTYTVPFVLYRGALHFQSSTLGVLLEGMEVGNVTEIIDLDSISFEGKEQVKPEHLELLLHTVTLSPDSVYDLLKEKLGLTQGEVLNQQIKNLAAIFCSSGFLQVVLMQGEYQKQRIDTLVGLIRLSDFLQISTLNPLLGNIMRPLLRFMDLQGYKDFVTTVKSSYSPYLSAGC